jgi:hypothetical protein
MRQENLPSVVPRQVYMVLSPRALPYARYCIESLLKNSYQALHLHLITDSNEDKLRLIEVMDAVHTDKRHRWDVVAEIEMLDREATTFRGFGNLRTFRTGHPCWRKITDPLLLSEPGEELVLLDPDVYFPNLFQFEVTPESGLLLMFQRPNCLLPPEIVSSAFENGIPLADHVDIGVAHWRAGRDLEWIDWLIGKLGGNSLPRVMHVEAIIWAAIGMHEGGGHLDPLRWVCWHRTQLSRLKQKIGVSGKDILRNERWEDMKCLHCGGASKWWLPDCSGDLLRRRRDHLEPSRVIPFIEFTREKFASGQRARSILRTLGYYKLLGSY